MRFIDCDLIFYNIIHCVHCGFYLYPRQNSSHPQVPKSVIVNSEEVDMITDLNLS